MPEILQAAGHLTAGFTGGGFVSKAFGFARGFDEYYDFRAPDGVGPPVCDPARLDGPEVFRRAIAWLERVGRVPVLLFVHTYDAHDRCPFIEVPVRFSGTLKREDRDAIDAHYARLVQHVDGLLGSLVEAIERQGRTRTTFLVVTSDHGEALWEHGFFGHGQSMRPYEELARIPLIVRIPGRGAPGSRVAEPVSLIDVAPTILGALGVEPPRSMQGRRLPGLGFEESATPVPVYVDSGGPLAVRLGRHVLLTEPGQPVLDQVFDVVADPEQKHPLTRPPVFGELNLLAERYWEGTAKGGVPPLAPGDEIKTVDPATRDRLRALGYLE